MQSISAPFPPSPPGIWSMAMDIYPDAEMNQANALQGELSKEEEAARKKINLLIKVGRHGSRSTINLTPATQVNGGAVFIARINHRLTIDCCLHRVIIQDKNRDIIFIPNFEPEVPIDGLTHDGRKNEMEG